MKKSFAVLSAILFLCFAALCPAPAPARAESPAPDVPVLTYKGVTYAVVLFTTDDTYIRNEFPFVEFMPGVYYWLVKLQAVGESAYTKPKDFPGMNLRLISDAGLELFPSASTSSDAVPPTDAVLFESNARYEGDQYGLMLNGQFYSLSNVPDLDGYSTDLFTPEPTATPEPKGDLQVMLEDRLQAFRDRSHPAWDELPALEGQVYLAVFNSSELLETSDEAAQAGEDFHGIPASRLAASYEEADTVLLIYRAATQVGYYSTGGIALRVYTYVGVIHGPKEYRVCIAVNEPPQKIVATIGNGGAGEYEPETALRLIAEKLAEGQDNP